jgi:hypothetical protein
MVGLSWSGSCQHSDPGAVIIYTSDKAKPAALCQPLPPLNISTTAFGIWFGYHRYHLEPYFRTQGWENLTPGGVKKDRTFPMYYLLLGSEFPGPRLNCVLAITARSQDLVDRQLE